MQLALGLSSEAEPLETSLRRAFAQLDISRRLTFEQAMAERSFAIGIRNIAEAHRRRCRRAAR
jgi:hypothetical protein